MFTVDSLGTEFKPNSKMKIAREAIKEFSKDKYGHTYAKSVAARYIAKPFNIYGETNGNRVWVYYSTYQPLSDHDLDRWRTIRQEEKIDEEKAACAFYRQENGDDISDAKMAYRAAVDRFRMECGDIPVYVGEWRLKR